MFFKICVIAVCVICMVTAFYCGAKKINSTAGAILIVVGLIFTASAFALTFVYSSQLKEKTPAHYGPEKGTAKLSLYVQDGANMSEAYYVEVTEQETYKFCYFHEDGEHIVKKEVPVSEVELICSDTDLPYRVEFYLNDGKPTLWQLHLPDDANTIQYDSDGK